jgi:hypothetical protein
VFGAVPNWSGNANNAGNPFSTPMAGSAIIAVADMGLRRFRADQTDGL